MNTKRDRKSAIKKLKNLVYSTKQDLNTFRDNIEKTFFTPIIQNNVEWTEQKHVNIPCDVLMPNVYSTEKIMIYIHGGSFVAGSRKAYRSFCASIAQETSCRVVVPEFRLPPTYTFPKGLEDLQVVFRSVFTEEQVARSLDNVKKNTESLPEIIIAADTSGASLAIALVLSLREKYRECISQVILFSPWLNFTKDSYIFSQKKIKDEILCADVLRRCVDLYTYETNIVNPLVSSVLASKEQLKGFPPVFIQMGEKEILVEDAKLFMHNLKASGVECYLDLWQDMLYMFQMADEHLEEAHLAIKKIGKLITSKEEIIKKNNSSVQEKNTL